MERVNLQASQHVQIFHFYGIRMFENCALVIIQFPFLSSFIVCQIENNFRIEKWERSKKGSFEWRLKFVNVSSIIYEHSDYW